MKKKIKLTLLIVVIIALGFGINYLRQALPIANGYSAKVLCSCVFVAERKDQSCIDDDLGKFSFVKKEIDYEKKLVRTSVLGMFEKVSVYREGLGCAMLKDNQIDNQVKRTFTWIDNIALDSINYPLGNKRLISEKVKGLDSKKLKYAIDQAFSEPFPDKKRGTRAIVVILNDTLVAEQYANGFDENTKLLGWSMTKSVTNALTGIAVKKGWLDIYKTLNLEEWKNDERKEITLDELLRMSSGLYFEEEYSKPSTAVNMLFNSYQASKVAIDQKKKLKPNEEWYYSSGSTNIIANYVMNKAKENGENPIDLPYKELFSKLNMKSAIMETDAAGYFVGSSFMYANAKDWARFGLLYLHDGVWNNERILPEGWVKYSSTVTPKSDQGCYGAQFWLNSGVKPDHSDRKWPDLPADIFYCTGYEGQQVFIVPSYNLVAVRLGLVSERTAWDEYEFIKNVLNSIDKK